MNKHSGIHRKLLLVSKSEDYLVREILELPGRQKRWTLSTDWWLVSQQTPFKFSSKPLFFFPPRYWMVEKQLESSLWHLCIINITIHFYSIMLIVKDIHYAKPLSETIVFILVYLVICCILTFPSEYLILNKIEIF